MCTNFQIKEFMETSVIDPKNFKILKIHQEYTT